MKMRPFGRLVSASEALGRLLRETRPIQGTEVLPLAESVGRVSAQTLRAPRPIPAFRRATWDGYALRSRDLSTARPSRPAVLRIVGEIHAEEIWRSPLRPGETVAIATGAPLPVGADSVVLFEEVQVHGSSISVPRPVPPGHAVAEAGEDFRRGDVLIHSGERLTPARMGCVGASGWQTIRVYRQPRVGLLPNGNELVAPGKRLAPGRLHEFNNVTLSGLVRALGGVPVAREPVPDDPKALQDAIEALIEECDLVVVTGGSSVGERDYLPVVFPRMGRLLFHGIRVRPGKPTLAVKVKGRLILGMPGHPTSCLSNAYWLLRPVWARLSRQPWRDRVEEFPLGAPFQAPTRGFTTILPVRVQGNRAFPTFRGSSAISSLAGADGYAVLGWRPRGYARGTRVAVHWLDPPLR